MQFDARADVQQWQGRGGAPIPPVPYEFRYAPPYRPYSYEFRYTSLDRPLRTSTSTVASLTSCLQLFIMLYVRYSYEY